MTVACAAFDQIESLTATSVALAIYARRARDGVLAFTVGRPLLALLNFRLNQLKIPLRSGALERLTDEQLKELAPLLKQLRTCLIRLMADEGLRAHGSLGTSLRAIQESAEDFESIVEDIYLALDPEFHTAVNSAIVKLDFGFEERATVPR